MKTLVAIILALPLASASAATITVSTKADNTTAGDGKCTLREAIANVNAAADTTGTDCAAGSGTGDTITFSVTLPATIRLTPTLGELYLAKDVMITGPVSGSLSIDGRRKVRVFHTIAGSTSISDLTIRRGTSAFSAGGRGGGVLVDGGAVAQITNCVFRSNIASGRLDYGGYGGGIEVGGSATLSNCKLIGNRATGHRYGNNGFGGHGGGIHVAGTATLMNCTLSENKVTSGGGGFHNNQGDGGGRGGALDVDGTATLINCTLNGNKAKGGSNHAGPNASGGGGININPGGNATLANSTLSGNIAISGQGGGIYIDTQGAAQLTNCTLSGNAFTGRHGSWSGILILGAATLTNTIVANGRGNPNGGGNCFGYATSGGHNLSSDAYCFISGGTDLLNTDPLLAPLANYGGTTETLALCTGSGVPGASCTAASPAIDLGDDAVTGPPDNLTDQRGLPRQAGAHVDIGAYEVQ